MRQGKPVGGLGRKRKQGEDGPGLRGPEGRSGSSARGRPSSGLAWQQQCGTDGRRRWDSGAGSRRPCLQDTAR